MTTTTTTNIDQDLTDKKYDEVSAAIQAAVAKPFTPKQKGAALVGLASAYMDVSNSINSKYLEALKSAVESLKKINAAESRSNEKISLAEVRAKLNS
jgi:hypothetical protein